jgi:hypothetical protein
VLGSGMIELLYVDHVNIFGANVNQAGFDYTAIKLRYGEKQSLDLCVVDRSHKFIMNV